MERLCRQKESELIVALNLHNLHSLEMMQSLNNILSDPWGLTGEKARLVREINSLRAHMAG
jgi:hypothetical protein